MLRHTRSKIATKVAKIEVTDDFQFSKWLRAPQIYLEEVHPLVSYDEIQELKIDQFQIPSSLKLKFKFQSVKVLTSKLFLTVVNPRAYLIFFGLTRPQLFEMKEKFLKEPTLSNFNSDFAFTQKVIDQSDIFIVKPASTIKYDIDFSNSSVKGNPLLIYESEIDDNQKFIPLPLVVDQLKKIAIPVITDHLASLIPEIYNIELLDDAKLENIIIDSRSFEVKKLKLPIIDKIVIPGIDDILASSSTSYSIPIESIIKPEVKYFSSEINFTAQVFKVKIDLNKTIVKKVVIKQKNFDTKILDGLNDQKISKKQRENVRALLSSYRELTWEEYSRSIIGIRPFENDGAKFLIENNFAVYGDELGYEKFLQSISGLNYLFKKGQVKSAIIISDKTRISEGWESNFVEYGKGLVVKKIDPEKSIQVSGYSTSWLMDIDDLGKLNLNNFSQIDLVILDEQINLKSASNILDELIKKIEPHYIWFLTAIVNQKYNKKFLENFSFSTKVDFKFYGKTLSDIQQDDPSIVYKDLWLQLDEMQSFEYAEALNQSREDLTKLIKNHNPIRFQSSIFTLIHKLKQILNFSSFRNISPKANVLIEHAEAIYRNKKKAIVFTQYDVNGMKKIEKAFELNNIKHIIARNGMSTDELKNSLNTFYDRKEIPILLTNLKPSRLDINLSKVSYIINFDQWWNPVSNWQIDDEIGLNEIAISPIIVFNYLIRNSFEEELKKLLIEKGLYNRKLLDNLKSETVSELILMDDWLSVFGMNESYNQKLKDERIKILNRLQSLEMDGFKILIKSFFTFLGYRDINIMDSEDEPMFYIIGTARHGTTPVNLHGKCSLSSGLKYSDYEEVILLKESTNEIKRKFVITVGDFAEKVINGTTYLDGADLANYILTLGVKSYLDRAN
jgi:hypothetical protein